jgi:hypothetical protein
MVLMLTRRSRARTWIELLVAVPFSVFVALPLRFVMPPLGLFMLVSCGYVTVRSVKYLKATGDSDRRA